LAGWAAIGAILSAAALVKGPQQLAFFFVGVGGYLAFRREWRAFLRLALCGLIPLVVVAAWYAAVYRPGDFAVWAGHSRISAGMGYAAYLRSAVHFLAQFALEALPGIVLAVPLAIDLYRQRFNTQRELTLVLLLYAFVVTALLVFWPGARTRYAMPAMLAIAALAGLGFDHFRLVRPWLTNVAAGIAAVLIGYALILNWLVMPLAPHLFEPFARDGRYVGQAVAGRPAPLLVTPEALNINALVYVRGAIRIVPLPAMRGHAPPFWALVTPEQRNTLVGNGGSVVDYNTLHWPMPVRFLRVEAD
jgi:4-amino-4-deoxy-L-arabinose transferase-like glycosyltransferase